MVANESLANAKLSRDNKLSSLRVHYPFWVFDVNQIYWPRRLLEILPGSHPAQLIGWYPSYWEYGTALHRIDDKLPPNVSPSPRNVPHHRPIHEILGRLRYDDRYDADTFRVVYEAGSKDVEASRDFSDWVFEPDSTNYIHPRRILRIERAWDGVPMWDRVKDIDLVSFAGESNYVTRGLASFVHDDAELLRATGIDPGNTGQAIRKVEFEIVGSQSRQCRGVVVPERVQNERGLSISLGPKHESNRSVLNGTIFEDAPWDEVKDFVATQDDSKWVRLAMLKSGVLSEDAEITSQVHDTGSS